MLELSPRGKNNFIIDLGIYLTGAVVKIMYTQRVNSFVPLV